MTQAIIFTNDNGSVSVCIPTGELSIEQVLVKDCPVGAIIIDTSELPTDNDYFDAWELVDVKVIVNADKKSAMQKAQCVAKAKQLLADSDWSMVSDVGLKNSSDYAAYRGILRGLVISPVVDAVFPTEPSPIWS